MTARESLDPKSSLWDLTAFQLRRYRDDHRLSGSALGLLLDLDRSSVSRLESGGMKLQEKHAKLLDRAWGTDGLFTCLVYFAKAGHDVEWFQTHVGLEARASELRIWELAWMPGLFQTEDYIRALVESAGLEDVDFHIRSRTERQACLARKPRPLVRVMLDQGVLDQPIGSPAVMREQLTRLLEMAEQPNITIRIILRSVGAHVGRDGSFKIMTVDGSDVAYTEACGGGRLVVDAAEVRSFRLRFDRISDQALPVDTSIKLIQQALKELQ